ncbi:MAG: arginine--tRNA ligase [Planctomycetota bacterium]
MEHESLQNVLAAAFRRAIGRVAGVPEEEVDPAVRPATDPRFGDFQCNAALQLGRTLKAKPREVAERIKAAVEPELAGVIEPLEIAGPGFLNIRFSAEYLARRLSAVEAPGVGAPEAGAPEPGAREPGAPESGAPNLSTPDLGAPAAPSRRRVEAEAAPSHVPTFPPSHLSTSRPSHAAAAAWPITDRVGVAPVARPQRVVVDYSQPNIAKQMHVGHLRSTIIGDTLARVLTFMGHDVIRQNHIGDWGTQFGMLIRWYRERPLPTPQTHADVLEAIEQDYKAANARFEREPEFAAEARRAVAELQGGDPAALHVWEQIRDVSLAAVQEIYDRLGVLLTPEDVRGESFYNRWLPEVVAEMRRRLPPDGDGGAWPGIRAEVREDQGAVCVFLYNDQGEPLFARRDGGVLPVIIQKSDGAYNYETTDLAGLRYRIGTLKASRILYVVDAGQSPHFEQVFAGARAAGYIPADVEVVHVKFGMVLGEGGKRIKTREGGTIKLRELLEEAQQRARELLEERERGSERARDQGEEPADWQTGSGTTRATGVAIAGGEAELDGAAKRWVSETFGIPFDNVDLGQPILAQSDSLDVIESVMLVEDLDLDRDALGQLTFREIFERAREAGLVAGMRATPEQRGKRAALEDVHRWRIARTLGIASIKYADLRNDRTTNYVFEWDKMISFQGNTAPYLLYAYARIRSIYRKAAERFGAEHAGEMAPGSVPAAYAPDVALRLGEPAERALGLRLARLRDTLDTVAADLAPHTLCAYLYDLAADFMRFYETCPVLAAPDHATRLSRMRLCDLTARTLKLGLALLGIEVLERM